MSSSSLLCPVRYPRHRTQSRATRSILATAALLASTAGCAKKDEATADGKTAEGKADTAKADQPAGADAPAPATQGGKAPAGLDRLNRGKGLGHIMLANPSAFLTKVKQQAAPAAQANFVDESFLRSIIGMQLGERSAIATHIDLGKPFGCALIESTVQEFPVACVLGYQGSAAALVTDLGATGKDADPAGHVAKYTIDDQTIFIDELAGDVVVTTHADVFKEAKDYLQTQMLDRAAKGTSDLDFVAFPGAAITRYEAAVKPLLEQANKAPQLPADSALTQPLTAYFEAANKTAIEQYKGMEQVSAGFSFEPHGAALRYGIFAASGSSMAATVQASADGHYDVDALRKLPEASWVAAAFNTPFAKIWSLPELKEQRQNMVESYAKGVGRDPAATSAAVEAFLQESAELYVGRGTMAFVHLPDTLGGAMFVSERKPGKDTRASYQRWAASFVPAAVLGAEAAKDLTWSFQMDAAKIGDTVVDRWIIEPTPAGKTKLLKDNSDLASLESKLGGLKLVINRFEIGDQVAHVIAPGSDDAYVQAVIDGLTGTKNLQENAGLTAALAHQPTPGSVFMAMDVAKMLGWIRELMPEAERAKMPTNIGNSLSDVTMSGTIVGGKDMIVELQISQKLIDQLRALAEQAAPGAAAQ